VSSAAQTLLARLIDDAGQFPPARKPLARAVEDFRAAKDGPHGWMVGRFLCPASRLGEADLPRPLGVVADGPDWAADLAAAVAAGADAFELRDPGPDTYSALDVAPLDVFVENPADLNALATHRLGAKLRCGGLDAAAFPSDAEVAGFIEGCRREGIPFKATAGLHHPFRTRDHAIGVLQHGFVNLLAASVLDGVDLEAVIAEADPSAFAIGPGELAWRDARADREALEEARGRFTAFGSCSVAEPVQDLLAHGILEPARV